MTWCLWLYGTVFVVKKEKNTSKQFFFYKIKVNFLVQRFLTFFFFVIGGFFAVNHVV